MRIFSVDGEAPVEIQSLKIRGRKAFIDQPRALGQRKDGSINCVHSPAAATV